MRKLIILLIILLSISSQTIAKDTTTETQAKQAFITMGKKVIASGGPEWQVKIYKKYINHPELLNVQFALVTSYNGGESCGRIDAHGNRCTTRTAAANLVPQYKYIWTKFGLRQVLDSGAKSNDRKAKGRGCSFWVDYWYPTSKNPVDGWNKTSAIVLSP